MQKFSIKEIDNSLENVQRHMEKLSNQLKERIQW